MSQSYLIHDPEAQARRRAALHQLHLDHCFELYCDDGTFSDTNREAEGRGYYWHALTFLSGEAKHVRRANGMLRFALGLGGGHFWSSAMTSALARFADKLDLDLREQITVRLATMIEEESRQRFRGYNDNYPAMAALSTLVGGYLVNETRFVESGLESLHSLRRLLTRRGVLSEYGSPTYTPITITCLAEIAELSPNAEARELARLGEERIWCDLASRFHPETSSIAGPHSRAYTVDLCAHLHNAHVLMYLAFGDAVFVNPAKDVYPPGDRQVLHNCHPEFTQSHVSWHATATYHVPPVAAELALGKRYPCVVEASSEQAAFPRSFWKCPPRHERTPLAEFAAGPMHSYSSLREDFAFGVSDTAFLDGYQHTAFHIVLPRRKPAAGLRDVATIFSRFITDDKPPRTDELIAEEGRTACVASDSTALVLYNPKPQWGVPSSVVDASVVPIRSLKVSLVATCFWDHPEEIWIGTEQVDPWNGESEEVAPVFLRSGGLFLAVHPLINTNFGCQAAIRLEQVNGFGLISLVNFAGEPRTFMDFELFECHNGFVAEMAASSDWPDFAAFRAFHARPQITDEWAAGDGMRHVRYRREGLSLAIESSPVSGGIKYRAVNDRLVETPKFRVSGFDLNALPWM